MPKIDQANGVGAAGGNGAPSENDGASTSSGAPAPEAQAPEGESGAVGHNPFPWETVALLPIVLAGRHAYLIQAPPENMPRSGFYLAFEGESHPYPLRNDVAIVFESQEDWPGFGPNDVCDLIPREDNPGSDGIDCTIEALRHLIPSDNPEPDCSNQPSPWSPDTPKVAKLD